MRVYEKFAGLARACRQKHATATLSSALCFAVATGLLNGCGGATTNQSQFPTTPSGPTIYGVQLPIGSATQMGETSGYGAPDYSVGYVTGAVASNAKPPIGIARQNNGTIPFGFFAGGEYIDGSFGAAAAPGAQVAFAVDISNGNDASGHLIPINPSSVTVSNIPSGSPDLPAADAGITFSQPLHFQFPVTGGTVPVGPFSNCTYTTNSFTLPFSTTGLHGSRATVADTKGNTSFTDFYTLVLAPSDSAVLVQVVDAAGAVPGAVVSITNALPGVTAYNPPSGQPAESVTDSQGIAIVFASPGSQTISVTDSAKSESGNDTQTLVGGQVLDSLSNQPYQITIQ